MIGWWFGTFGLFFHSVGNVIIPTDFHSIIFQRGRAQPPTSNSRLWWSSKSSFFGIPTTTKGHTTNHHLNHQAVKQLAQLLGSRIQWWVCPLARPKAEPIWQRCWWVDPTIKSCGFNGTGDFDGQKWGFFMNVLDIIFCLVRGYHLLKSMIMLWNLLKNYWFINHKVELKHWWSFGVRLIGSFFWELRNRFQSMVNFHRFHMFEHWTKNRNIWRFP